MNKIAIIGAGWLGKPLAEELKNNALEVHCSTTTPEKAKVLNQKGIPTVLLSDNNWEEENLLSLLKDAKIAIITIPPPSARSNMTYIESIKRFIPAITQQKVQQVFFTSSTTVYISLNGEVDENSKINPQSEMDKQIIGVEDYLCSQPEFTTTILRLGGLIGDDRHPVRFLAQRNEIKDANEPVNMIHLEDIIRFLSKLILLDNTKNEIYNLVAPIRYNKRIFYTNEAKKLGLKLPPFTDNPFPKNRKVDGRKITLVTGLDYTFTFE